MQTLEIMIEENPFGAVRSVEVVADVLNDFSTGKQSALHSYFMVTLI